MNIFQSIGKALAGLGIFVGSIFGYHQEANLASINPIGGQTYTLSGSGISSSASSITIQSLTVTQTGQPIQQSDLGTKFDLTIEPGNKLKQEVVECTTVAQNANGTATVSGCSRGMSPIYPYTASSTIAFTHAGGSQIIFSDPPQLFNRYAGKENSETISGTWTYNSTTPPVYDHTFTVSSSSLQLAPAYFVAGAANTASTSALATVQTNANAFSGNNSFTGAISFSSSNVPTYTSHPTFSSDTQLIDKKYADDLSFAGVSNASTITKGIVEIATDLETASSTSTGGTGAILAIPASSATSTYNSATAGLKVVVTQNNGTIDPNFLNLAAYPSTISVATSSITIGSFPAYNIGKNIKVFTSTGTSTFAIPSGITKLYVRVQGAGGGGGVGGANVYGASGGAGGFAQGFVDVTGTSSVQVFVGSKGTGHSTTVGSGNAGTWSTFGTNGYYMYANGGLGGGNDQDGGGNPSTGGTASGGDINIQGQIGQRTESTTVPGMGGSSQFGFGGNNGSSGTGYGSGGGSGKGGAIAGGDGADGIVIISW